jgi:MOSC domain-containing protein YiiM
MIDSKVVSVHVGLAAPLGPQGEMSAFIKHNVEGPVMVGPLGLAGDQQADLKVHGGPDKAVYGYAASHYAAWATEFPALASKFVPGGVGENLAIEGLDESGICVGDVHSIGETLLQVCQPRQPCFKCSLGFNNNRLPRAMVRSGRSGWYYRVVQPGRIEAGNHVQLHARPNPDFAFARLVKLVNRGEATREELLRLAEMEGLARQWRVMAQQSL